MQGVSPKNFVVVAIAARDNIQPPTLLSTSIQPLPQANSLAALRQA
jgi:hypothetical protein